MVADLAPIAILLNKINVMQCDVYCGGGARVDGSDMPLSTPWLRFPFRDFGFWVTCGKREYSTPGRNGREVPMDVE